MHRSPIARPQPRYTFVLLVALAIALFSAGYIAGHILQSKELARCRNDRKTLVEDLSRAVARGIIIEKDFILCKEERKK